VTEDPNQHPAAGQHAGRSKSEAEHEEEKISLLFQRDSKLSTEEVALLHKPKVFRRIIDAHRTQVWDLLRMHRLERHDAEEIYQDVFVALRNHIVETGFPKNRPGLVNKIVSWKVLGYVTDKKRAPPTEALPSSGSVPMSAPDLDRILDLRMLQHQTLPKLSPEHREVVEKVILNSLSHTAAAEELGLTEGRLKARLLAARRALYALTEEILPPSQRGTA
jgi:DNA-directed RNA polymerase specialized sigma24 family protein